MSCAKDPSVTNFNSNDTNNKRQYTQNLTVTSTQYINSSCRKISNTYPSFSPTINNLSTTSSEVNINTVVYIDGTNFLPPVYGTTYVNFGNFYKNVPIVFYSTSQISFVVPLDAIAGTYEVTVVNVYNGNFSPSVNITYAGNLNFSNSILYYLF